MVGFALLPSFGSSVVSALDEVEQYRHTALLVISCSHRRLLSCLRRHNGSYYVVQQWYMFTKANLCQAESVCAVNSSALRYCGSAELWYCLLLGGLDDGLSGFNLVLRKTNVWICCGGRYMCAALRAVSIFQVGHRLPVCRSPLLERSISGLIYRD